MAENASVDERTRNMKIEMAEAFEEYEVEYREDDGETEIVYEDDECVIIADHTGHAVREWADTFDVPRDELRSTFRSLADQKMSEEEAHEIFTHADPVVFDKLEA